MVEIAEIRTRPSLEAWLKSQPREVSVWIASRAAARVMPLWWKAILTEHWVRDANVTEFTVLRNLLISVVATKIPTSGLKSAADAARSGGIEGVPFTASSNADGAARAAVSAAVAPVAVRDAALAGFSSARAATADAATTAENAYAGEVWATIRMDAKRAEAGPVPDALPLWPDGQNLLEKEWADIKARVANAPDAADWQFWIDWYDAQLAGRTMLRDPARTWDMLEQIALIDPETWDAGPDVVNPKIREIWELYRLRAEVAALQAEKDALLATRASQLQRSHNQPPEGLVDDQPELARQITIVGNSLDKARDALEQDAPDKGWLRAIAEKLLSALTTVTKYCAKVADTAVISAAKVGGGAGGAAMVDYFANNGRLMQFAKDLLSYAAGV